MLAIYYGDLLACYLFVCASGLLLVWCSGCCCGLLFGLSVFGCLVAVFELFGGFDWFIRLSLVLLFCCWLFLSAGWVVFGFDYVDLF